jgi:hypothetical protein
VNNVNKKSSIARSAVRAQSLASCILDGGTVRSLAAAAGMMTALGVSPAFAQCFSGTAGTLASASCDVTAATGPNSTAIGLGANATGFSATAYGNSSTANGNGATATGQLSVANGLAATAMGSDSRADGAGATATGNHASATGNNATATGQFSTAIGDSATATGQNSFANGDFAIATGGSSVANGATASAYGASSNAAGEGTTAIGQASQATATGATAIGQGATASFANSMAIGNGATTTAANQVSIGTVSNTYRMSGINSAASLAAQSGPVKVVTTDAAGNLATASFTPQDITGLQANVATLQTQMKQAFEGTAIAIAMGGAALPSDKKFAISTNWGTFRGENAASLLAQMRVNENIVVNAGLATGFSQGGVGGRAGVTFAW